MVVTFCATKPQCPTIAAMDTLGRSGNSADRAAHDQPWPERSPGGRPLLGVDIQKQIRQKYTAARQLDHIPTHSSPRRNHIQTYNGPGKKGNGRGTPE
ncbi:unnamed protein product [Merluccius merluccius]